MLTTARFREVCDTGEIHSSTSLTKGQCILIQGKVYYIMAKLAPDAEHPVTYNICDENLTNPQFGLTLTGIGPISEEGLTEMQKRRARNFV